MGSHPGVSPGAHLLEHLGADRLLGQDEVVQATVDAYHGDVGTQMYRCAGQPLHVQNGVNVPHVLVPGRRQVAARRHEAQHRYVDAQPGTYSLLPGDDGGEPPSSYLEWRVLGILQLGNVPLSPIGPCLLYTSDAADE